MNDPTLQPMAARLVNTPAERLRQLLLAVVAAAMYRNDDGAWVASDVCEAYLRLIGLDEETALAVRVAFLQGRFDPHRLWLSSLDAPRFPDKGATLDDEVQWDAWSRIAMG